MEDEVYTCMFGGKVDYLRWKELCMDAIEIVSAIEFDQAVVVLWKPRERN